MREAVGQAVPQKRLLVFGGVLLGMLVLAAAGIAEELVGGTVVVVGKGITFDSGGLSIKTMDGMMTIFGMSSRMRRT